MTSFLSHLGYLAVFLSSLTACWAATCSYDCSVDDEDLSCWRENIDVFSNQILDAVSQRVIVANHIGEWKRKRNKPIFDGARAGVVLDNIVKRNPGPLPDDAVRIIFENIVNQTTIYEQNFIGTPPKFECPTPCYYDNMWSLMVAVVAIETIILVGMGVVVVLLLIQFKRMKARSSEKPLYN